MVSFWIGGGGGFCGWSDVVLLIGNGKKKLLNPPVRRVSLIIQPKFLLRLRPRDEFLALVSFDGGVQFPQVFQILHALAQALHFVVQRAKCDANAARASLRRSADG